MSLKEFSKSYVLIIASLMLFVFAGCSSEKKAPQSAAPEQAAPAAESSQALPEGHPKVADQGMNEMAKAAHAVIKTQKKVKISDEVKNTWKAAKLEITDAASKQKKTLVLKVGSSVQLNDAGLKLVLDTVVPDYAIAGDTIESRSNEAKNPAVLIEVFDGKKSVEKGWVFKDFPEFNSYTDINYPIVLVEPISGK